MIKKGYQMTCEGCGKTTFVESTISPRALNFKPGVKSINYNKEQSDSWVIVHKLFDLCPTCAKIHEQMLCVFYEKCNDARKESEEIEK